VALNSPASFARLAEYLYYFLPGEGKIMLNQDSSAAPDDVCAICLVRIFFSRKKKIKKNLKTLDSFAALDIVCATCLVFINEHFFFIHFFFVDTCGGGRVHELQ
jgi:hypothetical protein